MTEPDLRYPLHYPAGWKRTTFRQPSQFDRNRTRTFAQARDELLKELELLNAKSVVLSTNIPLRGDGLPYARFKQPEDPGVAVYFRFDQKPMVLACDSWDRVIDNVWAIAKHINALRGQQRWGVGTLEQAFMGYEALPESTNGQAAEKQWWEVLGVSQHASWDEVRGAYRNEALSRHPDRNGGDRTKWDELERAYRRAETSFKIRSESKLNGEISHGSC
ncbi:DnaJ domain-containing protein [Oculatella sp. LEGE 06141]|uniref:DnaJ domain-containing protein n=1 Tax=Oculatella sp. LEGE 06141 TaxID=1828648 RepID=UPI0018811C05|nr:DnaJ domain-containing protein [Oculatella sp. LEGE 06141]MBE9178729.1 DnaJ domain-containing protein [Oculatella sp. LEGE 06141]